MKEVKYHELNSMAKRAFDKGDGKRNGFVMDFSPAGGVHHFPQRGRIIALEIGPNQRAQMPACSLWRGTSQARSIFDQADRKERPVRLPALLRTSGMARISVARKTPNHDRIHSPFAQRYSPET